MSGSTKAKIWFWSIFYLAFLTLLAHWSIGKAYEWAVAEKAAHAAKDRELELSALAIREEISELARDRDEAREWGSAAATAVRTALYGQSPNAPCPPNAAAIVRGAGASVHGVFVDRSSQTPLDEANLPVFLEHNWLTKASSTRVGDPLEVRGAKMVHSLSRTDYLWFDPVYWRPGCEACHEGAEPGAFAGSISVRIPMMPE